MAGSWGASKTIMRRRRKKSSSRRWALLSKRPATCKLVDRAAPSQTEDTSVVAVQRWVPSLGVRWLLRAAGNACQVWKHRLCQVYTGFLNAMWFWRGYAQQIKTLQNQMAELQKELGTLRPTLQGSSVAPAVCQCHGMRAAGSAHLLLPPPPPPPGSLMLGGGSDAVALAAVTQPPPPPPPPPPPAPPPPPSMPVLKPFIPKKGASINPQSPKGKQDRVGAVTLMDLQAVKLRKVTTSNSGRGKKSPDKVQRPLVTVADLQRVSLRRSYCDLPPRPRPGLSRTTSPRSPMNLRPPLKRVLINRSPGGTPQFDKENMETGTGLTPLMIQALRRKFHSALPRRPSPTKNINQIFDDENLDVC